MSLMPRLAVFWRAHQESYYVTWKEASPLLSAATTFRDWLVAAAVADG
jgi:hypothetical protein